MISRAQAEGLYRLARSVPRGQCIVEVGSYRGRSTLALALGSLAGQQVPVFAIEPHDEFTGVLGGRFGWRDRTEFMRSVVGVSACAEVIRLINLPSVQVARSWQLTVGLLHLDGDHSYEGVASDFDAWSPHLASGSVLALDDATDLALGPHELIHRRLVPNGWRPSPPVDNMIVLVRDPPRVDG